MRLHPTKDIKRKAKQEARDISQQNEFQCKCKKTHNELNAIVLIQKGARFLIKYH